MSEIVIKIQNFNKFKGRTDVKNLTWFRMNADIVRSQKLFGLSFEAKWFFIFLLSSAIESKRKDGLIEFDISWAEIFSRCSKESIVECIVHLHKKETILIIKGHKLLGVSDDPGSDLLPQQHDEQGNPPALSSRLNDIKEIYNKEFEFFESVKSCKALREIDELEYEKLVNIETSALYDDYWHQVFQTIKESDYLTKKANFNVTLSWILKEQNSIEIMNGKYDNKEEEMIKKEMYKRLLTQAIHTFKDGDDAKKFLGDEIWNELYKVLPCAWINLKDNQDTHISKIIKHLLERDLQPEYKGFKTINKHTKYLINEEGLIFNTKKYKFVDHKIDGILGKIVYLDRSRIRLANLLIETFLETEINRTNKVVFKDGNDENVTIQNLKVVERKQ